MRKLLSVFLFSAILVSCQLEPRKLEKPFIITGKMPHYSESEYRFQDKNGKVDYFIDIANKYNIGDTIK